MEEKQILIVDELIELNKHLKRIADILDARLR